MYVQGMIYSCIESYAKSVSIFIRIDLVWGSASLNVQRRKQCTRYNYLPNYHLHGIDRSSEIYVPLFHIYTPPPIIVFMYFWDIVYEKKTSYYMLQKGKHQKFVFFSISICCSAIRSASSFSIRNK